MHDCYSKDIVITCKIVPSAKKERSLLIFVNVLISTTIYCKMHVAFVLGLEVTCVKMIKMAMAKKAFRVRGLGDIELAFHIFF